MYTTIRIIGSKFINFTGFKNGPMMGVIYFIIGIIELVSEVGRVVSFSFRLFGNMFAGEQVTLVFMSLTKLVVPVIFMGLHVFVALVQAYVFTTLTMIYIAGATAHGHGDEHGHGHDDAHAHAH